MFRIIDKERIVVDKLLLSQISGEGYGSGLIFPARKKRRFNKRGRKFEKQGVLKC